MGPDLVLWGGPTSMHHRTIMARKKAPELTCEPIVLSYGSKSATATGVVEAASGAMLSEGVSFWDER